MKSRIRIAVILMVTLTIFSCKKKAVKDVETIEVLDSDQKESKDCKGVRWSHHKGDNSPENWKTLCGKFSECGDRAQSPVNIISADAEKDSLKPIEFAYGTSNVAIVNSLHTLQFNVSGNNTVKLKGKDYKLLQFHYHALSEHTINGKHAPIEVHFVHKYSDLDYAVLGIMIEVGEENELLKSYLKSFPISKGEFLSEEKIDLLSLFPSKKGYFNYKGSLTTPPCSQIVDWFILKTPIRASKEQIDQFSKLLKSNYRPIQPLNDRVVRVFE